MPSNKVSLYDGIINIENGGSCDLSGMVCKVNNGSNIAMGATTIAFDNYVADSGNLFDKIYLLLTVEKTVLLVIDKVMVTIYI